MRAALHIILHFVVPGIAARIGFRRWWRGAWVAMVLTMLVDLDHLVADPIYSPGRCSIGFHPLHSEIAIIVYVAMAFVPLTRVIGVGLLIHMALDQIDCWWMAA